MTKRQSVETLDRSMQDIMDSPDISFEPKLKENLNAPLNYSPGLS
jgi:hypothetical protein